MRHPLTTAALVAVLAILAAWALSRAMPSTTPAELHPEPRVSAEAEAYRRRAEDLQARATIAEDRVSRLQAALRARSEARPRQVVVYDTVIQPETVTIALAIDGRGRAELLRATKTDSAGSYTPERVTLDLSACDDGIALAAGRVICDGARLGHLSAFARLRAATTPEGPLIAPRAELQAGLRWTPSYRSGWAVEISADQEGRIGLAAERRLELF